jgi:hypothetical protein
MLKTMLKSIELERLICPKPKNGILTWGYTGGQLTGVQYPDNLLLRPSPPRSLRSLLLVRIDPRVLREGAVQGMFPDA